MPQSNILTLLPQTSHPGSTGIESSLLGTAQQSAAYYISTNDLQTISWNFANNFLGNCKIQASLVTVPTDLDWFDVYTIDTLIQLSGFYNLTGNFVWLRASVDTWTQGQINVVTLSY